MPALLSLLLVLVLSYVVVRVGAVALSLTGVPADVARFQAQSAFFGVGFTTHESEQVIAHPVRRRVVMLLMVLGNAGVVASVTSALLLFVTQRDAPRWLPPGAALLLGVVALAVVAHSHLVDQWLTRVVERALRRWTSLDAHDYASLLHLGDAYAVVEAEVRPDSWLAGHTLAELDLRSEGALVLGIVRAGAGFVGVPRGPARIRAGDVLVLYGRAPLLRELRRRPAGPVGDRAHGEASAAHVGARPAAPVSTDLGGAAERHPRGERPRTATGRVMLGLALALATPEEGRAQAVRAATEDTLAVAVLRRLDGPPPVTMGASRWRRVRALYARRAFSPHWLDGAAGGERAAALLEALADAHQEGLSVRDGEVQALRAALAEHATGRTAERTAAADLELTAAFVALGEHLLLGRIDPRTVDRSWRIEHTEPDVDGALARALQLPTVAQSLASLRPTSSDYEALRRELVRYRRLAAAGGWRPVDAGRTLRPGDTTRFDRVRSVAERLRAEGYAPMIPSPLPSASPGSTSDTVRRAVYDRELAAAIVHFQRRHGIRVDSVLGPETLAALNVTAEYRAGQIAANLERHRWLPRALPERRLEVNTASFELRAFDGPESLSMRVIVGAPYDNRDTPSFRAAVRAVVFRPYWNVPPAIAANEIWPRVRRDAGYLTRHRYEVVWRDGGRQLRQRPGPANALGLVKFDMPNRFNIYLHDTPLDSLFCEAVRTFSHGCIRLEQPAQLAAWVLGWHAQRVRSAMEGPDDRRVELDRPLPVTVAYLSAYVREGELFFAADAYGRDAALVRALRTAVPLAATTHDARPAPVAAPPR